MGRKLNVIMLLSLSLLLSYGAGCQDTGRFAVAGTGGTLGLGGEFTAGIASNVNARIGMSTLDFDIDDEEFEDVKYDLGVDLNGFSALADWYIFEDSFHLTGGFISLDNSIDLDATPSESVDIGNNTYTPAQIGTLSGSVDIDGMAPYFGIGWGNPLTHNQRWGFTLDLGVAFSDSPDVSLTSSTGIVSQSDLSKEIDDIEDDLDILKFYPVIYMSFFYRF